jgi:hypothetical protein
MAKFKIVLFRDDGHTLNEMIVVALWRQDAIDMAERVAVDAAAECCGYEVWRGATKVAHRAVGQRSLE